MADRILPLDRRTLLTGLGAAALSPAMSRMAAAQGRPGLSLQAKPGMAALRPGVPEKPIWSLATPSPETGLRFKRGDQLDVTLGNDLPVPAVLNWRGIDGVPSAEPLLARVPVAGGARARFRLPRRHAGTFRCDIGLSGDGQARPSSARAFAVNESEPVTVDR